MRQGIVRTLALLALGFAGGACADGLELSLVAASAENLAEPHDIVLSPDGSRLFVADNNNDRIVVLETKLGKDIGSDHRPLLVRLAWQSGSDG